MRRLFWLGAGLAVGALLVRRLTRTAESYTPAGLADGVRGSAAGLLDAVRDLVDEVRAGAAERETELLGALAADGDPGDVARAGAHGR